MLYGNKKQIYQILHGDIDSRGRTLSGSWAGDTVGGPRRRATGGPTSPGHPVESQPSTQLRTKPDTAILVSNTEKSTAA